jgi:hypothetical protein
MTSRNPADQIVHTLLLADVLFVVALVGLYAFLKSILLLACGLPLLLGFNYLYLHRKLCKPRHDTGLRQATPAGGALSLYVVSAIFLCGTAYGVGLFSTGELPPAFLPTLVFPFVFGLYLLRQARKARSRAPTGRHGQRPPAAGGGAAN